VPVSVRGLVVFSVEIEELLKISLGNYYFVSWEEVKGISLVKQ
jgi:hypothetical protein